MSSPTKLTVLMESSIIHCLGLWLQRLKCVNKLPSKSPENDQLSTFLVKKIAPFITVLVKIFNLSLPTGVVTETLKIVKVTPVFKNGDRKLISTAKALPQYYHVFQNMDSGQFSPLKWLRLTLSN